LKNCDESPAVALWQNLLKPLMLYPNSVVILADVPLSLIFDQVMEKITSAMAIR
jgi:hypothetical protein